jgi:hypothetical protein
MRKTIRARRHRCVVPTALRLKPKSSHCVLYCFIVLFIVGRILVSLIFFVLVVYFRCQLYLGCLLHIKIYILSYPCLSLSLPLDPSFPSTLPSPRPFLPLDPSFPSTLALDQDEERKRRLTEK